MGIGYIPTLFYIFAAVFFFAEFPSNGPQVFETRWAKKFYKKFLDLSAIKAYKLNMIKYILEPMSDNVYQGTPKEIVQQLYADSEAYFKTHDDFRKGFAEIACDWSGKYMRYGTDEELVEDLIQNKLLKRVE